MTRPLFGCAARFKPSGSAEPAERRWLDGHSVTFFKGHTSMSAHMPPLPHSLRQVLAPCKRMRAQRASDGGEPASRPVTTLSFAFDSSSPSVWAEWGVLRVAGSRTSAGDRATPQQKRKSAVRTTLPGEPPMRRQSAACDSGSRYRLLRCDHRDTSPRSQDSARSTQGMNERASGEQTRRRVRCGCDVVGCLTNSRSDPPRRCFQR